MFEWNSEKSDRNLEKHGISFYESTQIWQSKHLTMSSIASSKGGENRSATIGFIRGKLYTAIWTQRAEKIRIISVRRSRENEQKIFKEKRI
jgi:uncharacterized DUF497 family protein